MAPEEAAKTAGNNSEYATASNKSESKKVFFDIANSVKGGSGKSTFSLLLAAYYNSIEPTKPEGKDDKSRTVAYIIDLDLRGTSWEKNYGRYITTPYFDANDDNTLLHYSTAKDETANKGKADASRKERIINYSHYPFINSLMHNCDRYRNSMFWSEIPFIFRKTRPIDDILSGFDSLPKLFLCPARTSRGTEVDQVETDIFEHTIYQMILDILNRHRVDDTIDAVHIIFDMPPSYEKHAESIIKHLLTSQNSELFQMAKNEEGLFRGKDKGNSKNDREYYLPYVVNVFMLSAVDSAHVEQNGVYLYHWFQNLGYSDSLSALMMDNRFRIRYVLNDISNVVTSDPKLSKTQALAEWAESNEKRMEGDNSSYYKKVKDVVESITMQKPTSIVSFRFLKHLPLYAAAKDFHPQNDASYPFLLIPQEVIQVIQMISEF